jgi:CheY-like chemotaxis protein
MNIQILVVEDEGLIALDLKNKLERSGYTVPMIANNAKDALKGVESFRPSLVLMDIRLRGPEDGVETADLIRLRFHVPVMFVTAHADRETLDRARLTAPVGFIVKPFNTVDFRAEIETALWKHKMRTLKTFLDGEESLYVAIPNIAEFWNSATKPVTTTGPGFLTNSAKE